ncbi:TPA: hypothetical protein ACY4R4_001334 [Clostridium perfringens]
MKRSKYKFIIVNISITIILTLIAIEIAFVFKISKYGNLLEIKDFFNFAGSFGGAILASWISIIILIFTLEKQKEQFDEERKIERLKLLDEKRLNKINNDIATYREVYDICKNMLSEIEFSIRELERFLAIGPEVDEIVFENFRKSCDTINRLVNDFIFVSLTIENNTNTNIINLNYNFDKIYKDFKLKYFNDEICKQTIVNLKALEIPIENYIDELIEKTLSLNESRYN